MKHAAHDASRRARRPTSRRGPPPTCSASPSPRCRSSLYLLVEWVFGDTLVGFASDLLRGFDALPDWIVLVLAVAGTRVVVVVALVAGLALTIVRTGWRMLLTVGAGGG